MVKKILYDTIRGGVVLLRKYRVEAI